MRIHEEEVKFSTEYRYSKHWFYPRHDSQIHEPDVTSLAIRLSQDGGDIIDVGANLGWFSCTTAIFSNGTVHASELDRENLRRLKKNVMLNSLRNVKIKHAAVADSKGHLSCWKDAGSASPTHGFYRKTNSGGERFRVEATTLDTYIKDHCRSVELIKVDVEGAEQMVMDGAQHSIKEFHPYILFEVHPDKLEEVGGSIRGVLERLLDAYRVYSVEGFRKSRGLDLCPIDTSTFAPNGNSMLFAEPPSSSLSGKSPLTSQLYEFE